MSRSAAVKIDGQTKLMGVLGHQISFTLSPVIHNYAANQLGQNIAYVPFDVAPVDLESFLNLMWKLGCQGFNVTTPHKQTVASLVKTPLTSVNTVVRGAAGWEGDSTDGVGFAKSLARVNRTLDSFSHIVFLGNGGAVVGLLEYFRQIFFQPRVTVLRRSPAKDAALHESIGTLPITYLETNVDALRVALQDCGKETLFVQATSAPLHGDDLSILTAALDNFDGVTMDLIYNQPSKLYFHALSLDKTALDGEAMLIEQARASQVLWWRRTVPYDDLVQVIRGRK